MIRKLAAPAANKVANAAAIVNDTMARFMPGLLERYPGIQPALEGQNREAENSAGSMLRGFIVGLIGVYLLLSFQFRSYIEPVVVMIAIPLALVGVFVGHTLLGIDLSMPSIVGMTSLAGVVVNDSLIMVDFINKARIDGMPLKQAIIESGTQRFRAIILTSFTTAAGLMPIMLETELQAQFVIPMAISLSFGILFATFITLFLVPALYLLQLDGMARVRFLWDLLLGRPERPESSA